MTSFRWIAVCFLLLAASVPARAQAGPDGEIPNKPRDLIIGTWKQSGQQNPPPDATIEFTKKGEVIITVPSVGLSLKGTYKFLNDKTVALEVDVMGKKETTKATIKSINKDEMVIVVRGMEEKFKRNK